MAMEIGSLVLGLLLGAALVAIGTGVSRRLIRTTTVFEYQRGLRFDRGRFAGELGPGRYRHGTSTHITVVDTRSHVVAVSGQEVPSSDGVAVRCSAAVTYHVTDATRAVLGSSQYGTQMYQDVQLALRSVIASHTLEELMSARDSLNAELLEAARAGSEDLGIDYDSVAIRDLAVAGDLKRAFAEVVKARQEGLAALERARGETAALRNLANAAQLIERNPALMQLRFLQAVGQQDGGRLVLNFPGTASGDNGAGTDG